MKKTSTILLISSGLFLGHAQAEVESEFHVGFNSDYIFRGAHLGVDATEFGLDVGGSAGGLDWSAGIWNISPSGELGFGDEQDVYFGVSKDLGAGALSLGYIAYTYDDAFADDAEINLGYSTSMQGVDLGLTVSFGTAGTVDEAVLLEVSAGKSFAISETATASLGVTYGTLLDEGGFATDGTVYVSVTGSIDYALSDSITLSPYISYVDGEADVLGALAADAETIGGAILSFSF